MTTDFKINDEMTNYCQLFDEVSDIFMDKFLAHLSEVGLCFEDVEDITVEETDKEDIFTISYNIRKGQDE